MEVIKIATNTPGKRPDCLRLDVAVGAETPVTFHGAKTIIALQVQCIDAIDMRVSYESGGTLSGDNYWTVKSGDIWKQEDISWTPPEEAMYVRIPVSPNGDSEVEIMYWS